MVTDEMVEKAAAGYWDKVCSDGTAKWPDDVFHETRDIFREGCRAALESALSAAEPEDNAELIATAKQWYDWSREWSGSAFLNDEPTGEMTEVECKTELYRGLCSLGNHMMWLEDQLRSLPTPALSAQVQDVAEDELAVLESAYQARGEKIESLLEENLSLHSEINDLKSALYAAPAKQEGDSNEAN